MIGISGAAMLVAINIIFAALLGVGAGGITCLVLRRPWGFKMAVTDAVIAALAAVISAYVVSAIDNARGVLESRDGLVLVIAAASIVIKHVLRVLLHSSG